MGSLLEALPEWCRKDFVKFQDCFKFSPDDKIIHWKEHTFVPQFHPHTIAYAYDHHEPKENEIMVASFPKTGTTWTREIIRQILYAKDEELDNISKDITLPHLYLETCTPSKFNVMHNIPLPRRYFVTHIPAELVNVEKYKSRNIKIIYTIRNPKDRLVSWFHFSKEFPVQGELAKFVTKDWNVFFKYQMKGEEPFCMREGETYLDHILSWLPHINGNKNAIMMVYEEMIKNPRENVKKLAEFLEVEISEEDINKIVENCSIETMKKTDAESETEDSMNRHVIKQCRKGKIGSWKEYFTEQQSDEVDREVEKKLKGTGISFIYE